MPANTSYDVPFFGRPGKFYEIYTNTSQSSPKISGKLVLQQNNHFMRHSRVAGSGPGVFGELVNGGAEAGRSYNFTPDNQAEVLAKFRGKLHSGGASMGVTLASWRQSASMISRRSEQIGYLFDEVAQRKAFKARQGRGPGRKPKVPKSKPGQQLASVVLEGEFGWVPLLADIYAAVFTVASKVPPSFVRASSRYIASEQLDSGKSSNPRIWINASGYGRIVVSAKVEISNPNLWLLNRLGVINPLTVAWDLVPWSFVVNMFVNVNQVLGSLTDYVGLTFPGGVATTLSSSILTEQRGRILYREGFDPTLLSSDSWCNVNLKQRARTVSASVPTPPLRFKVPDLSWETALIASALVVQKIKKF